MAGQTITRADLSEAVYQQVGLSRYESAALVETVLDEISNALAQGESDPDIFTYTTADGHQGQRRRTHIHTAREHAHRAAVRAFLGGHERESANVPLQRGQYRRSSFEEDEAAR